MSLAQLVAMPDDDIKAVAVTVPDHAEVSRLLNSDEAVFRIMIGSGLSPDRADALDQVLASYGDIFDIRDRPLGQIIIVKH